MKNNTNIAKKTIAILFALLIASSIIMLSVPANAQTQTTNNRDGKGIPLPSGVTPDVSYETIAHMSFRPNPIGINQPMLVNLWMQPPIHVATSTYRIYGDHSQNQMEQPKQSDH